jgi:hypothetical protein
VGHLEQQRGARLVEAGRFGQALEIAYAQASGFQHLSGLGGERLEQRLGAAHGLHHLARAGRVDGLGVAGGALGDRRERPQRPQRTGVAPQQQADLAGQLDQLTVGPRGATGLTDRHQHVVVDQPAHRLGHRLAAERTDRRPGGEPVEHRAGAWRGGQHRTAEFGLVGAERGRLGVQEIGGTAQTGRVGRGDLVDRADELERVVAAVQQETNPEAVDRDVDVFSGDVVGQLEDRGDRGQGGLGGAAEPGGIEDGEGELVQAVEAARDRAAGLSSHGEGGDVGGNGHDEVRTQLNERAERLVGERPQLIGECGGHRLQR